MINAHYASIYAKVNGRRLAPKTSKFNIDMANAQAKEIFDAANKPKDSVEYF
jgi:hypothetical protein